MRAILCLSILFYPLAGLAGWEFVTVDEAHLDRDNLQAHDLTLPADGGPAAVLSHGELNMEYTPPGVQRDHILIRYVPPHQNIIERSANRLSPMLFGNTLVNTGAIEGELENTGY